MAEHAKSGWMMVVWLFIALLGLGVFCSRIAIPMWKRFKTNRIR